MVDTPLTQHAPAVKVGGRRMSAATRHRPQASVDNKSEDASKTGDQAAKDADDSGEDEVMRKKRREAHEKQNHEHHYRKEQKPMREPQGSFKAFAGQRIAQPAGKGLGI